MADFIYTNATKLLLVDVLLWALVTAVVEFASLGQRNRLARGRRGARSLFRY